MKRVWSDESKYGKWLLIELAACEAWAEEGVIPQGDLVKLRGATLDIGRVAEEIARTRHDMPAFLRAVSETLGPEARWLHLGLTTSDVWDTTTSLQLVDAADLLSEEIDNLIAALKARAIEHKDTPMMGRTHGVHAEPITFGLKLAVWFDEMRRHSDRLDRAREGVAFGKLSGPVGTHATVPPSVEARVCQRLGLKPAPASNQVLQRDRHADFVLTLALTAASLEKFATEIRGLQRTEIGEVSEPFPEGEAGSSSMPHKRNPELSERVCGLARLIRGHGVTALENVALWGERDISHSSAERIILPDSTLALDYILSLMVDVVTDMHVYPDRMMRNMESTRGVLFSQRVMLELVETGLLREEAYGISHRLAMRSVSEGEDFRELVRADPAVDGRLSSAKLDEIFDYGFYLRHVDEIFERVGLAQPSLLHES